MMYDNKLVAALKVGGKILREFKDTVYVPFGAEYSILIKNLNTVRAAVDIFIDGTEATEGVSLIVDPKEEFELTRYIKNGNLNSGNRFKFIERTAGVEQHRGVKMEDGIIRIEFQFERERQVHQPFFVNHNSWPYYTKGGTGDQPRSISKGLNRSCSIGDSYESNNSISFCAVPMNGMLGGAEPTAYSASVNQVNDAGITVPGSISNQQFTTVSGFQREFTKHSMVLRLLGETAQGVVEQPVFVKTKPTCTTCGRVNKATAKFCTDCGTALQIV